MGLIGTVVACPAAPRARRLVGRSTAVVVGSCTYTAAVAEAEAGRKLHGTVDPQTAEEADCRLAALDPNSQVGRQGAEAEVVVVRSCSLADSIRSSERTAVVVVETRVVDIVIAAGTRHEALPPSGRAAWR